MSSRGLDQYRYIRLSHMSSEDILNTSSGRLHEGQYIRLGHASSRRYEDVLPAFWSKRGSSIARNFRHLFWKTSVNGCFWKSAPLWRIHRTDVFLYQTFLCVVFQNSIRGAFRTATKRLVLSFYRNRKQMLPASIMNI